MIVFRIVVNSCPMQIASARLDTEDLLGVITGQNKSYTKILNPNSPNAITVTIHRAEVEE